MKIQSVAYSMILVSMISACGGAPSESDVRKALTSQLQTESAAVAATAGINISDVLEVGQVKIKNSAEDGKNSYTVDVESTAKFKKSLSDYDGDMNKGMVLRMTFGDFKAGQESPVTQTRVRMTKGDNGWMIIGNK